MAKDPSSGQSTGPRPSKAGRKSVTIDLDAEDVGKGGTNTDSVADPVAGAAKKPVQSASSETRSSKAAGEPVKAKADKKPTKPRASGAGKKTTAVSAASRLVAAFVGGGIALGGAVALDRLRIVSIFGAEPDLSEFQSQITGVKDQAGSQIADLQARIAALPATSAADAGKFATLDEKITQIEASLAEQSARIAKAERPQALADLGERLAALERAVQSGAAGPDAGLAAIEQMLAGVEEEIADIQRLAGGAAKDALAAIKPEIDRLGATADDLAGRVKTLEGGLSDRVDPQTVTALGARVEQLAGVIDKGASQHTIATLKSALAAESLAAAVAAGRSFAAELAILQSEADGGPDLTAIAAYAEEGLPDAAALAAEFEALIPSLLPPEPERPEARESAGLVDRLLASARNVVEVREAGPGTGGELARQTGAVLLALNGNNFDAARTAWQGLPPEARQASAGWAAKLEARLAADKLAGMLRKEALSRLATTGGGEGQ